MLSTSEHPRSVWSLRAGIAAGLFLLAWCQLSFLVHDRPPGDWFLFGTDTVSHDAVVQLWIWDQVREGDGYLPLWMPPLKGGLPTLGAFLWTPFAPSLWLHAILDFPLAQRLQFVLALWWGALGGYWLGRVLGMRRSTALLVAVGFGFCGHVVTLIHAGHLQKVLALVWMPWFAGGLVKAFASDGDWRAGLNGVAAAALALGAAFLSGHPQIAYVMVMLAGWRFVFAVLGNRHWRGMLPRLFLICLLGGCVGAAQLLPGMQMGKLSNRAAGVEFAEAVETSYPPSETLEIVLPRFLGDNSRAGHGVYHGQWGERIVSDYAGVGLVLLAMLGGLSRRRKEWVFWAFVAMGSLLVGFGNSVPLYRGLYEFWPGMKSFRSPGTFMAAMALALPVMAGLGTEYVTFLLTDSSKRRRAGTAAGGVLLVLAALGWLLAHPGKSAGPDAFTMVAIRRSCVVLLLFAGLFLSARLLAGRLGHGWLRAGTAWGFGLLLALDLMLANSAFLIAVDWKNYSAYLAPDAVDEYAVRLDEPRRVLEVGREQSLRPILNGRDAMLGYHPISFGLFEEHLNTLGAGTPEWREAWGVQAIWLLQPMPEAPEDWSVKLLNRAPGGVMLFDPGTPPGVRFSESGDGEWEWVLREPNREVLDVKALRATTIRVAATLAPGWRWRVDEGDWSTAKEVALVRSVALSPGTHVIEWEYRPFSFRVGVFLTGLGFAMLLALHFSTRTRESVFGDPRRFLVRSGR